MQKAFVNNAIVKDLTKEQENDNLFLATRKSLELKGQLKEPQTLLVNLDDILHNQKVISQL